MRTGATILLFLSCILLRAQNKSNPYGLTICNSVQQLQEAVRADSNRSIVRIADHAPTIQLDIKYAGTENVFYEQLYTTAEALVRLPVAKALTAVQFYLQPLGVGLKIWDAYRPYHVTVYMYNRIPDSIYMATPWRGSKHNRGIAVDLTLVDLSTGKELQMPTPFDALVYPAHPKFTGLPDSVIKNRDLLISSMQKFGFTVDPLEWWHFNFTAAEQFELLDIPFNELQPFLEKHKSFTSIPSITHKHKPIK